MASLAPCTSSPDTEEGRERDDATLGHVPAGRATKILSEGLSGSRPATFAIARDQDRLASVLRP